MIVSLYHNGQTTSKDLYKAEQIITGSYYSSGVLTSNTYVDTMPLLSVAEGDRIVASSCHMTSQYSTASGIRVGLFYNNTWVKDLTPAETYQMEYIEIPEGVNQIAVPFWRDDTNRTLYHYVTSQDDVYALDDLQKLCRTKHYGGLMSLSFDIAPSHPYYGMLAPEVRLEYDGRYYNIKTINERSKRDIASVTAELDIDDLCDKVWQTFTAESLPFSDIASRVLDGSGWTIQGANVIPNRRSPELNDVNRWGVLEHLQNSTMFDVVYDIDNKSKVITVDRPTVSHNTATGVYFSDELNLKDCNYKGSSTDICTRLYPYGKDNLNIALYNGGREYVDNHTYTDKIISKIWRDDRYTNAESLRDAAIEKLKTMAIPNGSFTCKIYDLAKAKPDIYGDLLACDLYDIVTLIQRMQNTQTDYRIVEYKEYPDNPQDNEVTFNAMAGRITTTVQSISDQLNDINVENIIDRTKYNELERTVEANVARIGETYTKGETDNLLETKITQTSTEINSRVTEVQTETTSAINSLHDDLVEMVGDTEAQIGQVKTELQSEISQTAESVKTTVSKSLTNGATNYISNARNFENLDGWQKNYGNAWTMKLNAANKQIVLQRSSSTTLSTGWVTCAMTDTLCISRARLKYLTVSLRIKADRSCRIYIGWRYKTSLSGTGVLGNVPTASIKAGNVTASNYYQLVSGEWTDCYAQIYAPTTSNDYYIDRIGVYLQDSTDYTGCPPNTLLTIDYLQITDTATYEQRIAEVEVTADGLTSEVSKKVGNAEWSTKLQQSYQDIQISWNKISEVIQFINATMKIYDGSDPEDKKVLFDLSQFGMQFYDRQSSTLGHIGLRAYSKNTSYKAMAFNLDKAGKFLCWAYTNSLDVSYMMLAYFKDNSINSKGFHFYDTVYLDNHPIYFSTEGLRSIVYTDSAAGFKIGPSMPFGVFSTSDTQVFGVTNRGVDCYGTLDLHGNSIVNQSDARLKDNIQPAQMSALDVINSIQMMSYDWIETGEHEQLGIIAQQLKDVAPELVEENPDTHLLGIKTTAFIPYLVKAVQELTAMVQSTQTAQSARALHTAAATLSATVPSGWTDPYTPEEKAAAVDLIKNKAKTQQDAKEQEVI
ncbi:MAG: phage tail spike protein [Acutalibacteraceae bacterium]|nr:phage tail spike protein [Acutalibacteraceae bacterium]